MNEVKLDHITINVKNMEKSIKFYKDLIGLKMLNCVDMNDHILQYFDLSNGTKLELIEYKFNCNEAILSITDKGIYRHIAFVVDDIMELYDRVLKAQEEIKSKPTYINNLGFTNFLMNDPNGVELEILQYK